MAQNSYEQLSKKEKFLVDCFAAYWTPARIAKAILQMFGDAEELKIKTINVYRTTLHDIIVERRQQMQEETPIMNPAARFQMAQELYDMCITGVARVTKGGQVINLPDPKTAVSAVKLANDMSITKEGGEVPDDDLYRAVVAETYEEIKKAHPKWTTQKIIEFMSKSLTDDNVKPYLEELTQIN